MTDRSRLRQFIFGYFNDDELEDLTFDYFPDVQKQFTTGMNKSQKAAIWSISPIVTAGWTICWRRLKRPGLNHF